MDGFRDSTGEHGVSIEGIGGTGGIGPHREPVGVRATDTGRFARVIEIEEARRRRMTGADRIPEEVRADMARAAQLADDLAARGQAVRFDVHGITGKVAATLCDDTGAVVRQIGLGEMFGLDPDPASAA